MIIHNLTISLKTIVFRGQYFIFSFSLLKLFIFCGNNNALNIICSDELPVQLTLPRAMREAKNHQQLSSLALLGQGKALSHV